MDEKEKRRKRERESHYKKEIVGDGKSLLSC